LWLLGSKIYKKLFLNTLFLKKMVTSFESILKFVDEKYPIIFF